MTQFPRRVEVRLSDGDAGTLKVTDLKIEFEVSRENNSTPPEGDVRIWNFARATSARVQDRARRIVLIAGYQSPGTILDGMIRRIEHERDYLDRVTKIAVGGQVENRSRKGFVKISLRSPTPVREIVTEIVRQMELKLGSLEAIPPGDVVSAYWHEGSGSSALDRLLRPRKIHWTDDNGTVRFSGQGKPGETGSQATMLVTPDNGMVGTPTVLEDGHAKVRTLLRPQATLGSVAEIRSSEVRGRWKIAALIHRGDNRHGHFYTDFSLAPLEGEEVR